MSVHLPVITARSLSHFKSEEEIAQEVKFERKRKEELQQQQVRDQNEFQKLKKHLALQLLREDLEKVINSNGLLEGTPRKGLTCQQLQKGKQDSKELKAAQKRSKFLAGVYQQNNKFEGLTWEQFVELVVLEKGFGTGSSVTVMKFKDIQEAYLAKAEENLAQQKKGKNQ